MIPKFSIEKIRRSAAQQRKNELAMKFLSSTFRDIVYGSITDTLDPVTSIYVPTVMINTRGRSPWEQQPDGKKVFKGLNRSTTLDAMVDPKDYMWFLPKYDDIPSFVKNRTIKPIKNGLIYTTLDGTDARGKLKYELEHFAGAYPLKGLAKTPAGKSFDLSPSDLGRRIYIGAPRDRHSVVFMLSAAEPFYK